MVQPHAARKHNNYGLAVILTNGLGLRADIPALVLNNFSLYSTSSSLSSKALRGVIAYSKSEYRADKT